MKKYNISHILYYILAMALIVPWLHLPSIFISRDAFVNFVFGYGLFTFLIIYGGRYTMIFGGVLVLHRILDLSSVIVLGTYYPGIVNVIVRVVLNDGGAGAWEFFTSMYPKIILSVGVGLSHLGLYYYACKKILTVQNRTYKRKVFQSLTTSRPMYKSYLCERIVKMTIIVSLLTLGWVRKSDMEIFLWDTKFSEYQEYLLAEKSSPVSSVVKPSIDVYLVIGESASRNHLSLYGYDRKTSPFLDRLYEKGMLTKYDGYSPAGTTAKSFTAMFSSSNTPNIDRFFTSPTVIEELNHMGYKTVWITYNRRHPDSEDGHILNALGRQASVFSAYDTLENDLDSIDVIRDNLQSKPSVYFVHTFGSHIDYNRRVLEQYKKFSKLKAGNYKQKVINEYDDTLLHLDRLHKGIYSVAENHKKQTGRPYAIIYVSDHGQVMFADGSDWQAHPVSAEQIAGFEVPFFVINQQSLPCSGMPPQGEVVDTGKLYNWVLKSLCGIQ